MEKQTEKPGMFLTVWDALLFCSKMMGIGLLFAIAIAGFILLVGSVMG
ncbi:MAG: hypothetical protein ABFS42_17005 [Candidatus Krumholzibacteriota bacterium]